jgi:hypothetical protein
LKKISLGPLRQGQRLDTSKKKQSSSKEHKPPNQSSKNHKELPLYTCKLPLNQCNSPWTNACKTPLETRQLQKLSSHQSDRSPPPVRPVLNMCTGSVGVLDRQTYQGVPEVVDCAVGIVIRRLRTQRYAQGHGTQDLYRFGLPRWRTLCPVWGIKYGAPRLVLVEIRCPARYPSLLYIIQGASF